MLSKSQVTQGTSGTSNLLVDNQWDPRLFPTSAALLGTTLWTTLFLGCWFLTGNLYGSKMSKSTRWRSQVFFIFFSQSMDVHQVCWCLKLPSPCSKVARKCGSSSWWAINLLGKGGFVASKQRSCRVHSPQRPRPVVQKPPAVVMNFMFLLGIAIQLRGAKRTSSAAPKHLCNFRKRTLCRWSSKTSAHSSLWGRFTSKKPWCCAIYTPEKWRDSSHKAS